AKAPIIVSTTAPGLQEPSPRTQALMQRLQTGRLAQPLGGGRYRIAPLEAGTYEVRADDGVNPSVLARAAGASQIVVAHAPVEARVTIDAQSSIRGRVVDGAGGPVSDVWVSASSEDGAAKTEAVGEVPAHQRVLTDDDGRFEVAGLAGNARYSVRVERPFGALSLQRGVTPGQDVTIRLPALGGLSGTLIDPTGQPLPPFTIQVRELDTGHNQAELIRDPNGNWKLERVQPGTLRVSAILDGSGRVVNQTVELHEGEQLARIQLRLPER
ncbi:MAG TPA: carboxypeptidase-like regulatory domain-containing protein, partial [Polyangiales bacterium]|nr:carboxypeptidase-like regulatory domain-containing protein [Polyangiales bacterium]